LIKCGKGREWGIVCREQIVIGGFDKLWEGEWGIVCREQIVVGDLIKCGKGKGLGELCVEIRLC